MCIFSQKLTDMLMKLTSSLLALFLVFVFVGAVSAQQDKSQRPSPPATASNNLGETKIVINYGSPAVKGRDIWGKLVPYGKVWRTGANEATTFEVSTDVFINGKRLPAGRYALFTIPGEEEWTVIFNKEADQWGAYNYKESQDALRINVTPQKNAEMVERLTFRVIANGEEEAYVLLYWEHVVVGFDLKNSL